MRIEVLINVDEMGHCVRVGDRYEDHLTNDEALYIMACLIVTGSDYQTPYLRTKEQHEAADAALGIKREEARQP